MNMKRMVGPSLFAVLVLSGGFLLARKDRVLAQEVPEVNTSVHGLEIPEGYSVVEGAEERSTAFAAPESVLEDGRDYAAVIQTSAGNIVIELHADKAPATVNNFVFLALNRYYDGIVFHRVLEDFMAQTGDPTGTGTGGPGYEFADEFDPMRPHDAKGVVSMANAGPATNGSQFFITFIPTPWLDGRHSVFGRVIEGEEVLDRIQRIDPGRPFGPEPDVMERVTILATRA